MIKVLNLRKKILVCLFTNVVFIPFFVVGFWSVLAIKLQKYYVIFVYILQGKMGKTEKNRKENHATKVTKIPKTKRSKYGMSKTLAKNTVNT